MKCVSCGAELAEHVKFCTICGTPVKKEAPAAPVADTPPVVPPVTRPVTPPPVPPVLMMPPQPKLLGPWAYFGLQILFSIPLVGFICLIVFSLDDSNLNRRNFARSYWCGLIISLVLIIAIVVLILVTGASAAIVSAIEDLPL